jgi:hypothetical protein
VTAKRMINEENPAFFEVKPLRAMKNDRFKMRVNV